MKDAERYEVTLENLTNLTEADEQKLRRLRRQEYYQIDSLGEGGEEHSGDNLMKWRDIPYKMNQEPIGIFESPSGQNTTDQYSLVKINDAIRKCIKRPIASEFPKFPGNYVTRSMGAISPNENIGVGSMLMIYKWSR